MNYEDFKKMMMNAPEDSELYNLRVTMEKVAIKMINSIIHELMQEYSLSYGEAYIIARKNFERYYKEKTGKTIHYENTSSDIRIHHNLPEDDEIIELINYIKQGNDTTVNLTSKNMNFLENYTPVWGSLLYMKLMTLKYDSILDVKLSDNELVIYCIKDYDMDEVDRFVENELPYSVLYRVEEVLTWVIMNY